MELSDWVRKNSGKKTIPFSGKLKGFKLAKNSLLPNVHFHLIGDRAMPFWLAQNYYDKNSNKFSKTQHTNLEKSPAWIMRICWPFAWSNLKITTLTYKLWHVLWIRKGIVKGEKEFPLK